MASNNLSSVILEGHVVKDLEVKASQTGTHFVCINLAVNKYNRQIETTMYINCYIVGEGADRIINAKVHKGSAIIVTGELASITPRTYTNRSGETVQTVDVNVNVWNWQYVSATNSKPAEGNAAENGAATAPAASAAPAPAAKTAKPAPAPVAPAPANEGFVELGADDDLPF